MGLSLLMFFLALFDPTARSAACPSPTSRSASATWRSSSGAGGDMDPHLEEAARDLGASAWGAFRYVTLPIIAAGDLAGALLPSPCRSTTTS